MSADPDQRRRARPQASTELQPVQGKPIALQIRAMPAAIDEQDRKDRQAPTAGSSESDRRPDAVGVGTEITCAAGSAATEGDAGRACLRPGQSEALGIDHRDVVLAPGGIRCLDERTRRFRTDGRQSRDTIPAIAPRAPASVSPSLHSSSAASGLEWLPEDVDELRIVRVVELGSDVAVDLVAARVLHRIEFAQFAGVFALAHG
jgi:hypothetical protein